MAAATNENCIGEEMKLLTAKDLNLLRGIFLMGEMSKSLAVG